MSIAFGISKLLLQGPADRFIINLCASKAVMPNFRRFPSGSQAKKSRPFQRETDVEGDFPLPVLFITYFSHIA